MNKKGIVGRIADFIEAHECDGCKRRRAKVKAFFSRAKRDLMRQRRVK